MKDLKTLQSYIEHLPNQTTEEYCATVEYCTDLIGELQKFDDAVTMGEWIRQNSDVKTTGQLLMRFRDMILGEKKEGETQL